MKNKAKKIITTTVVSALSLTAIACGSCGTNLNKSNENSILNNKKIEATAIAPNKQIGKIVETSTNDSYINPNNYTTKTSNLNNDKFNIFVLSSTPFISLTNENENELNINIKLPTTQTSLANQTQDAVSEEEKTLSLKKSMLMIYANEINNGNVAFSRENKININNQLNQFKAATSPSEKLNSINSVINIIESNFTPASAYFRTNLTVGYNNFNNLQPANIEINENSSNQDIANKLACIVSENCNSNNNSNQNNQPTETISNDTNKSLNNLTNEPNGPKIINSINNQNNRNYRNNKLINSRNGMQENQNNLRANRSQDLNRPEQYEQTANENNTPRATRMPYRTTANNILR